MAAQMWASPGSLRQAFALCVAAGAIVSCCLVALWQLRPMAGSSGYRLSEPEVAGAEAALAPTASAVWRSLFEHSELRPQPVPQLLPYITDSCSGRAPCIAFGTPLFHRWRLWLEHVDAWQLGGGQAACGVPCELVSDPSAADAILFHGRDLEPRPQLRRHPGQRWVYVNMESPMATRRYGYDVSSDPKFRFLFNWTATTSLSSSIHLPYGSWELRPRPLPRAPRAPAVGRRRLAFAVFSNCQFSFNNRTAKVAQLQQFMPVDVFGACGDQQLPRNLSALHRLSRQYSFYLSFENALCRDYITEKFHANGLGSHAVPVVFGGLSRADYERVSPPGSFVYALDFPSMRQLAGFLLRLAGDEARYGEFFSWKTRFQTSLRASLLCQVCAKLHSDRRPAVADLSLYYDVTKNCRPTDYQYLT